MKEEVFPHRKKTGWQGREGVLVERASLQQVVSGWVRTNCEGLIWVVLNASPKKIVQDR